MPKRTHREFFGSSGDPTDHGSPVESSLDAPRSDNQKSVCILPPHYDNVQIGYLILQSYDDQKAYYTFLSQQREGQGPPRALQLVGDRPFTTPDGSTGSGFAGALSSPHEPSFIEQPYDPELCQYQASEPAKNDPDDGSEARGSDTDEDQSSDRSESSEHDSDNESESSGFGMDEDQPSERSEPREDDPDNESESRRADDTDEDQPVQSESPENNSDDDYGSRGYDTDGDQPPDVSERPGNNPEDDSRSRGSDTDEDQELNTYKPQYGMVIMYQGGLIWMRNMTHLETPDRVIMNQGGVIQMRSKTMIDMVVMNQGGTIRMRTQTNLTHTSRKKPLHMGILNQGGLMWMRTNSIAQVTDRETAHLTSMSQRDLIQMRTNYLMQENQRLVRPMIHERSTQVSMAGSRPATEKHTSTLYVIASQGFC